MEIVSSFETSVSVYKTMHSCNPEDHSLNPKKICSMARTYTIFLMTYVAVHVRICEAESSTIYSSAAPCCSICHKRFRTEYCSTFTVDSLTKIIRNYCLHFKVTPNRCVSAGALTLSKHVALCTLTYGYTASFMAAT